MIFANVEIADCVDLNEAITENIIDGAAALIAD